MRCPICDYDNELGLQEQSAFFNGLSFENPPHPSFGQDGEVRCDCFGLAYDYEEEDGCA